MLEHHAHARRRFWSQWKLWRRCYAIYKMAIGMFKSFQLDRHIRWLTGFGVPKFSYLEVSKPLNFPWGWEMMWHHHFVKNAMLKVRWSCTPDLLSSLGLLTCFHETKWYLFDLYIVTCKEIYYEFGQFSFLHIKEGGRKIMILRDEGRTKNKSHHANETPYCIHIYVILAFDIEAYYYNYLYINYVAHFV